MASNKQISARIPKELYERFTEKVASEGKQSGKVIEQLLEAYCEGNIPDGSNEVASDNKEVVAKKTEINQLVADEVAKATQQLEARLEEVEGKLSKGADGSNVVETSYNEVENESVADDSSVVASDSKVVASDSSSEVASGSKVVASDSDKLILKTSDLSERLKITPKQIRENAKFDSDIIAMNYQTQKMEKWKLFSDNNGKGKKTYTFWLVETYS